MVGVLPRVKQFVDQSFGAKMLQAQGIIAKWICTVPPHKQAVAFSGGRDSMMVLSLVRDVAEMLHVDFTKIPITFENTGIEYRDTVDFVHQMTEKYNLNLVELKPAKTFYQCVREMGHYPMGKNVRPWNSDGYSQDTCCWHLKEKLMIKYIRLAGLQVVYTGITALESHQRMIKASTHGTAFFAKKWRVHKIQPILYFSNEEVRAYHQIKNLPENPVYSKGCRRCGCKTCTAHKGWEEELSVMDQKMYLHIKKDMRKMGDPRGDTPDLIPDSII
jgi:phosphoadenosine phosphosulfate reductase